MRLWSQWKLSSLKPALAGLLAALLFLLSLVASSGTLHFKLHSDSSHDHVPCAVCFFARGLLDAPDVVGPEVLVTLSVAWTLPSVHAFAPAAIDLSVASSRGPPVSVSSQS